MRKKVLFVGVALLGFAIPHQAWATALSLSGADSTWGTTVTMNAGGGTAPYIFTLAGDGCSWSGTATSRSLSASKATSCYATVTDSDGTPATVRKTIVFGKKTPTLAITNSGTSLIGSATAGVKILTSSDGTGAVTYTVADGTAAGCYVAGSSVFAQLPAGTCTVTAHQAENANFNAASDSTADFTLNFGAQAPLTISNSPLTRPGGQSFDLTSKGGSGTGAVTFTRTAGGCTVSGATVTAIQTGTCSFTATKAADASYSSITSTVTTFTFVATAQVPAAITNTVFAGTVGTPITVTATGGATGAAKTFTKSGTNCTIDATSGAMSATDATSCSVTVTFTKAGYQPVSATKVFKFERQSDTISIVYGDTALGTSSSVTLTDGHGSGSVTYKVSGAGCLVDSTTGAVTKSNRTGTCKVTATKAASTGYKVATATATAKFI